MRRTLKNFFLKVCGTVLISVLMITSGTTTEALAAASKPALTLTLLKDSISQDKESNVVSETAVIKIKNKSKKSVTILPYNYYFQVGTLDGFAYKSHIVDRTKVVIEPGKSETITFVCEDDTAGNGGELFGSNSPILINKDGLIELYLKYSGKYYFAEYSSRGTKTAMVKTDVHKIKTNEYKRLEYESMPSEKPSLSLTLKEDTTKKKWDDLNEEYIYTKETAVIDIVNNSDDTVTISSKGYFENLDDFYGGGGNFYIKGKKDVTLAPGESKPITCISNEGAAGTKGLAYSGKSQYEKANAALLDFYLTYKGINMFGQWSGTGPKNGIDKQMPLYSISNYYDKY